jgi:hypothetical protein
MYDHVKWKKGGGSSSSAIAVTPIELITFLLFSAPEWSLNPIEDTNQTSIQQYQQDVGYPSSQRKRHTEETLLVLRQEHSHLY